MIDVNKLKEGDTLKCVKLDDKCGIEDGLHCSIGNTYELIGVQSETIFFIDDIGDIYDVPFYLINNYFEIV